MFPKEVEQRSLFCVWKYENNRKIPYYVNGSRRQGDLSRDSEPLASYEDAKTALEYDDYEGIGIALKGEATNITCLDFDHVIDTSVQSTPIESIRTALPDVKAFVKEAKQLGFLIELSVSGEGLHIFGTGTMEIQRKILYTNGVESAIEGWSHSRFIAITERTKGLCQPKTLPHISLLYPSLNKMGVKYTVGIGNKTVEQTLHNKELSPPEDYAFSPFKKQRLIVTVRQALTKIPSDIPYTLWLDIAMALKGLSQYGWLSDSEAFDIYKQWNDTSTRIDKDYDTPNREKWENGSLDTHSISKAKIFYFANACEEVEIDKCDDYASYLKAIESTLFHAKDGRHDVDWSKWDDGDANGWSDEAYILQQAVQVVSDTNTPKAIEFCIDGFLPTGISVIAGSWGAGKTTNLLPMFLMVTGAASRDGFIVDIPRIVVWLTEDANQVQNVVNAVIASEQFNIDKELLKQRFIVLEAKRLSTKELAKKLKSMAPTLSYELPNGFVSHPQFVLDTANANVDLEDENNNSEVGKMVSALKLAHVNVTIVGHVAKGLTKIDLDDLGKAGAFRGAGAWEGDSNATYVLGKVEDMIDTPYVMKISKKRFHPHFTEVNFGSYEKDYSLETPWGTTQHMRTICGVPDIGCAAERRETVQEAREGRASNRAEIKIMAKLNEIGTSENPEWLSKSKLREALDKVGKVSFEDALNSLEQAGLIHIYGLPNTGKPGENGAKIVMPAGTDFEG